MDSDFGIALLAVGAAAGFAYAASKKDVTVVIHNQLQHAYLTSPVLFIDNGETKNNPAFSIAPRTSMAFKCKKRSMDTAFSGALIYELHNTSRSSYRFHVLIAWQAESFDSTRIYTRLLFDHANARCDANRLRYICQSLRHNFVKASEYSLMHSYIFQNGAGISLNAYRAGSKKQRELHLAITSNVNPRYSIQPLWIGQRAVAKSMKRSSTLSKVAGKAFDVIAEILEDPDNLQQMVELVVDGLVFLDL
jgi:hypothetical protein